ncbi:MAG: hypothetical protein KAJ18_07665 [Candidatus Omnitrophica bacterium]|nr:hypothetical protein [Candidatus Omnitrophota bacterium]
MFRKTLTAFKENKFFFIILTALFAIIAFRCFAFAPLTYFDEHNYLIEAQNIREHNINSLCNTNDNGQCQEYSIAPHGLGLSSIYALFYSYDFKQFYKQISFFTLFLYLLNSIFIFIVATCLFSNKNIAKASSLFILAMPYNIIYATNAMPPTLCNTLILIIMYCLSMLFDKTARQENQNGKRGGRLPHCILTMLYTAILLSSIRVEYSILLTVFIVFLAVVGLKKFSLKKIPFLTKYMLTVPLIALSYSYSCYYIQNKSHAGSQLGLQYFNFSYITLYFLNIGLCTMSLFFILYLIVFLKKLFKKEETEDVALKISLISIFFLFIILYSFYNYRSIHRYIIPVTSIFILFSTAGLNLLLKEFLKKRNRAWFLLIVLLLCILITPKAFTLKNHLIEENTYIASFIDILNESNLNRITKNYPNDSYYIFQASYLGQTNRINNYLGDYNLATKKLEAGDNLFYIESPFGNIGDSDFGDTTKFKHTLLEKDSSGRYGIYKIELSG